MEKAIDFAPSPGMQPPGFGRTPYRKPTILGRVWPVLAVSALSVLYFFNYLFIGYSRLPVHVPLHAADALARCRSLSVKPAPPPGFSGRVQSDRYEPGTASVLIRNASIWTGLDDGRNVVHGDILLENGLIKSIGNANAFSSKDSRVEIVDAEGAWVTPGIVDVHTHMAILPSPKLQGTNDFNSGKGITLPWLRSLDGLNPHDEGFAHTIAGGVTTSLILPGSLNSIGGQAFAIKLRSTSESSSSSLLVDPPYGFDGTQVDYSIPPHWRHMKHACGENPMGSHSATRMDIVWSYREAYNRARQVKEKQDTYCSKASANEWEGLGEFPEDLQWEALVDVLRGKVKVHTHCYEAVDIEAFVRLSNEFKFPIAAIHHASEAYLIPSVLKRAYEHPPAIAMFAAFARQKRESYRHSEFAPRILNERGLKVVMGSDHPGILSRWLLHEAQQAHYYGLPENVALASVTTNAAEVLGLDHRLGYVKKGYDADLVVWDSHPLSLGATPIQVFVDGVPQLKGSFAKKKADRQTAPKTPNFDEEAKDAVNFVGLPPLGVNSIVPGNVLFRNVSSLWSRDDLGVHAVFRTGSDDERVVLFERGKIVCAGLTETCKSFVDSTRPKVVNLEGGSITPALVSTGTPLGLQEIALEKSTSDGPVLDPLKGSIPAVLGEATITRAVDGLIFGTRDALIAYRSGVSTSITSLLTEGFLGGLSAHIFLGAKNKLERNAVLSDVAAVHVAVQHGAAGPSVSTQIAALRNLLFGPYKGERGVAFEAVFKGKLPLVVDAKNADIIASLLKLKQEVEATSGTPMKMTLVGAGEAHLVAAELAAANVGVVVTPPRPFPLTWEGRRIIEGPPVTERSMVATLFAHGVTVGLGHQGVEERARMTTWAVRNMRWDAGWVQIDSHGLINVEDVLNMATSNVERLLGVTRKASESELVATKGGELLSFEGKVVAVTSPRRGVVDLFE